MGVVGTNILVSGAASGSGWVVTPSIGLQELGTDNVYGTQTDKKADAITQVIPGLSITGDGPHEQVFFSYAPIFSADIAEPGQDRVDQNLLSSGKITFVDQLLSLDFNAFATQGSGSGGNITTGASDLVPLNDRTLNFGGSIAPHLHTRFGDTASLDISYQVSSSNTSGNDVATAGTLSSSLLQQDARVIVGSGDSFNRLSLRLNLDHSSGSGSGENNAFENDTDILTFEYHLSHKYSVIGYAGYQNIHYDATAQFNAYAIHGLIWSLGGRITPNDFTDIRASYSRQSGAYAPEVSIKYDLTARTRIFASYTVSVENQLQQNLSYLANLTGGGVGVPVDGRTGLPFNNTNNQLFGSANALYRDKLASLSLVHQFTRSSITVVAGDEERETLSGGGIAPGNAASSAWYGSVTYSRELRPDLQGYADIGYSRRQFGSNILSPNENDKLYNADLSLTYRISPTVTTVATFSLFKRLSNIAGLSTTSDQILIGIRKVF